MKLTAELEQGKDYEKGNYTNPELSVLFADKLLKKFSLSERKQIKIKVILISEKEVKRR